MGQAESSALGFSMGDEWPENTRQQLGGNPATGVGNFELQAGFGSFDCKREDFLIGFRHRFTSVANQIAEHTQEPIESGRGPEKRGHVGRRLSGPIR
jgi:hypothetical protein